MEHFLAIIRLSSKRRRPSFGLSTSASSYSSRQDDSVAAGSSSQKDVKYGIVDDNCDGFDVEICPDLLLAGIALFSAAAFMMLFQAITAAAMMKRKKRSLEDDQAVNEEELPQLTLSQRFWLGKDPVSFSVASL